MLVSTRHKHLIFKPKDADRVRAVIPACKDFHYKGHELLAVPHRVDEVKVLNNLGIQAPSPIRYYYGWPGMHKPFKAQLETAAFATLWNRCFILNDMGTGKTMSGLWAYDYLRSTGRFKRVLVSAPLSTLERTWADEVFRNFSHLSVAVLHGTKAQRLKLLAVPHDIYVVNHDGVKVILDGLKGRDDIDLVMVDELAVLRNAGTDRWKALNQVINGEIKRAAWGFTGTPIPNEPTDAWAQVRLICPERVPRSFIRFRETVMKKISQFKWVPRRESLDIVHGVMQPAIRFQRSDCVDMPPAVYTVREAPLSDEQTKAYRNMMVRLRAEFAAGEIQAVNEAVKVNKLIQIACGAAYGDGEVYEIPAGPRLEVVREVIEQSKTKTIVFVPLTGALDMLARDLRKDFTVEVIDGRVSKSERDRIFREFQQEKNPQVLLAQPAAMSHGLTLTAASTIVWYAPVMSNEIFEQANHRIIRPGQKHAQLIVMIEGTEIERRAYARLQHKGKTQGLLLDIMKNGGVMANV